MNDTQSLLVHLNVEPIDEFNFIGQSHNFGLPTIYGGQFLGQSLNAAYKKVDEDKIAHYLSAHFFLAGNFSLPVHYKVIEVKDGKKFSIKKVIASQNEKILYDCTISFQKKEKNKFEYQIKKPFIFRIPEVLLSQEQFAQIFKKFIPKSALKFLSIERPFDLKPIQFERFLFKAKRKPERNVWLKFKYSGNLKLTQAEQQQLLAYACDYGILLTSIDPFPKLEQKKIIMPTIGHSMWFHREFDPNKHLYYTYSCPTISNSRSFIRGDIFTKSGNLIASVCQEGLFRVKNNKL